LNESGNGKFVIDPPLADAIWRNLFRENVAVGDGWRNTVRGTPPRDMALTKEKLIGDYDWGALCLPTVPWSKTTRKMPFFARNDDTPLLVAAVMGLQHCFAMIGGEI